MSEKSQSLISKARIKLLHYFPLFGVLALRLNPVINNVIPTAATDGKRIYYNEAFFESLTPDEILFVFAHEILHCVYDHIGRRGSKDPKYWNMAVDFVVNWHLSQSTNDGGIGTIGKRPENTLYDKKYAGMTSEEIYKIIIESKPKEQKSWDVHLDPSQASGDSNGGSDGSEKGANELPFVTEQELQENKADFLEGLKRAVKQMNGIGNVPSYFKELIEELEEPKINWRKYIAATIRSIPTVNKTFMRISRRSHALGVYLPGNKPEKQINIAVALDTSGSVSTDQLRVFLSEIKGIMKQFTKYKIKIWCFDTEVKETSYKEFTDIDGLDITKYEIEGRGGTHFGANWTFMKENKILADKLIIFTDGECGFEGCEQRYMDTIWLVHNTYDNFDPPFGDVIQYEE